MRLLLYAMVWQQPKQTRAATYNVSFHKEVKAFAVVHSLVGSQLSLSNYQSLSFSEFIIDSWGIGALVNIFNVNINCE